MKNKNIDNVVWIIFLCMGILFFVISGVIYSADYIPEENRVETVATIESITEYDDDYDVLISYKVNNKKYIANLSSYSSSYYEGKEIVVYYDINNPAKIVDTTSIIVMLVFCGVGTVFIIIAVVFIALKYKRKRIIQNLKENGLILNAQYLYVKTNLLYRVNNRHPFNIYCESNELFDGQTHKFKSENIWYDPTNIINDNNINHFKVYVNPNNYKQYYMDISTVLGKDNKDK